MAKCEVCFRNCDIKEGNTGFCGVRTCESGKIIPSNYGSISSLALDPIEKKPLSRFYPGSLILSVGSFGCNLRCPFCQNHQITWSDEAKQNEKISDHIRPDQLAVIAEHYRPEGNIGLAFTYNEPLISYEFVRDTAKLIHEKGMKAVLVSNGTASLKVLDELAPYIDAMNIDLKGFTEDYYKNVLGGDLNMVLDFIEQAVKLCHVELTTLVVPGENDTEEEMRRLSRWIAGLKDSEDNMIGNNIPLHISRFFPRFHMTDRKATPIKTVLRLADIASENLKYVIPGNI